MSVGVRSDVAPRWAEAALMGCAFVAAYLGFREFWFLTDDAFITFRYVSNAMLGRGLVWNPAPFAPVEGYTSFLWTLLLLAVWRVLGVEPPQSANAMSLLFALGTVALVTHKTLRLALPARLSAMRPWIAALVLLGTLSNRTFLAWMSSGLETALFNFLVTAWFFAMGSAQRSWMLLFGLAAMLEWTRPDGLLLVAVTLVFLAVRCALSWPNVRSLLVATWPLSLVLLHLGYRYATYGELVPNTYFAKHVAPWPESGLRYLAAFALEYALWFWLLLIAVFLYARRVELGQTLHRVGRELRHRSAWFDSRLGFTLACAGLFAQFAYYTLIIGGDHFEFRIYSHLIPLLFMSAAYCAAWTYESARYAIAALALFVLLSWPIPWTHWARTRDMQRRTDTKALIVPIGAAMPWPMKPLALAWDELEQWLIKRYVGMRHQEHKVFHASLVRLWPSRERGAKIKYKPNHPVMVTDAVGYAGYQLPNVAFIDTLGLNDRVIARTPVAANKARKMAHDRRPPPGYVECFRPNVTLIKGRLRREPRALSDAQIRTCEQTFGAERH